MAFRLVDSFESYSATADMAAKWTTYTFTWGAALGRNGGAGIQATANTQLMKTYAGTYGTSGAGAIALACWIKISATPAAAANIFIIQTALDVNDSYIRVSTGGVLQMLNSSTVQILTGAVNICDNQWHWIELYWGWGSNTMKLTVDGIVEWNGASNNGGGNVIDRLTISGIASRTMTISHFMTWDSGVASSPTLVDYPLGPRDITVLRPNADNSVQFTRSSGSDNYALVDESGAPNVADYVESGTSGHTDLYDYPSLGISPATINAVVVNNHVVNPNPGVINFKAVAKSVATQTDGAATAAPPTYRTFQEPFSLDPNTAAAWTVGGVDAAQFGAKVA